jgi:hypothetical protein
LPLRGKTVTFEPPSMAPASPSGRGIVALVTCQHVQRTVR